MTADELKQLTNAIAGLEAREWPSGNPDHPFITGEHWIRRGEVEELLNKWPVRKFQIYEKGLPVSPEPSANYDTRELAEARIPVIEKEVPQLKGKLEVR